MNTWNIFISLEKLETVNELCNICSGYDFDVNAEYGRYVIDAKSILGVTSLLGKIVKIIPIIDDETKISEFYQKIENIGAYIV